ncbi:MAG: ATPase P [Bacillota bacterium]|nr:ATPase P [Bacillota bacterium]
MIINVPQTGKYHIENIVFDYNGTIANDGIIIDGILKRIVDLSKNFNVHIITADTFNTVKESFKGTNVNVYIIDKDFGSEQKEKFIDKLGFDKTIALGNGRNDQLMLKKSIISIAVLNDEGVSVKAINSADFLIKDINNFFDMIEKPKKMIAILRK